MERGDQGAGTPPSERRQLAEAFLAVALDPEKRPAIPFSYALDQLERRYGQPPGSARTWDVDDLERALEFQRLESSVKVGTGPPGKRRGRR